MVTFAYMAQGYFPPDIVKEKKEAMLEYCKLDTYAMVKLHQALDALSGRNNSGNILARMD